MVEGRYQLYFLNKFSAESCLGIQHLLVTSSGSNPAFLERPFGHSLCVCLNQSSGRIWWIPTDSSNRIPKTTELWPLSPWRISPCFQHWLLAFPFLITPGVSGKNKKDGNHNFRTVFFLPNTPSSHPLSFCLIKPQKNKTVNNSIMLSCYNEHCFPGCWHNCSPELRQSGQRGTWVNIFLISKSYIPHVCHAFLHNVCENSHRSYLAPIILARYEKNLWASI